MNLSLREKKMMKSGYHPHREGREGGSTSHKPNEGMKEVKFEEKENRR